MQVICFFVCVFFLLFTNYAYYGVLIVLSAKNKDYIYMLIEISRTFQHIYGNLLLVFFLAAGCQYKLVIFVM